MTSSTPEERDALLQVVRDVVRKRIPPTLADELVGRIEAHREAIAADWLMRDVNPSRLDADPAWDQARAALYAPTEHVGAVHLELGTFTTFPEARVAELVAGDGLSEFIRLDFDRHYRPDVVADVTRLPFGNATIDRVASNSLFEHVSRPHAILEETFRVLRPGGVMVVVMPFVWKLHGYPHDYVRLTPQFFQRVCREVGFAEVVTDEDASSGLYNVLHNASKMAAVDDDRPEAEALRAVHELVISLLGSLIPADRGFEDAARQWFHSVRVLARKPGAYEPSRRPRDTTWPVARRIADLLADPESKAPVVYEEGRLVCEFTGVGFPVDDGMAVMSEPRALERPAEPLRDRMRRAVKPEGGVSDVAIVRAGNPGPLTLSGTNTYVAGRDPCFVVDPGPALTSHVEAVAAEVQARGGAGWIALTHGHSDHRDAILPLRARIGAAPVVTEPADGLPFEVVRLPGHTADHVVFVWGRACFTGDAVMGEGSVFVSGDLGAYLDGLRGLRARGLTELFPGHGPPIGDADSKLDEYLAHRAQREDKLVAGLAAGARTVEELLDAAWSDAPAVLRPAAAMSLGAHLEKLEAEGRLPAGVERPVKASWAV